MPLADKVQVRSFSPSLLTSPAFGRVRTLLGLLVLLSFLPRRAKAFLHTRGPLHPWAHLCLFAAVAALILDVPQSFRSRVSSVGGLALLALLIELVQARLRWSKLELVDVLVDLVGIGCGVIAWYSRGAWKRLEAATQSQPMTPIRD